MKVNWKDKQTVEDAVQSSYNYRETLDKLGLRMVGANNATLKKWIKYHKIDMSHFDPMRGKIKNLQRINAIPLNEILEGRHPQYRTYTLKLRLLKEGIKENKCEVCGQEGTWNGEPLNMQLDHIDGCNDNHRLHNIRMICPNCHTQTETFAGKNKGKHVVKVPNFFDGDTIHVEKYGDDDYRVVNGTMMKL